MTVTELDQRVARAQNRLIPDAERVAGRPLVQAERATITRLIRESLTNPTTQTLGALAEWTSPKAITEQVPVSAALVEALAGAIKTGRHLLGRDLTEAEARDLADTLRQRETAKGTALTEAELSKLDNAGFRERLGEAQMHANGGRSPFFRPPQVRTGGQLSESAPAVRDQSMEALAAKMNALPAHSIERREAFEDLMLAHARTVPFGARRLDQA